MTIKVLDIDWNDRGFGHTPVSLTFRIEPWESGFILTRYENCAETKSIHDDENSAKAWAQAKYNETVLSALAD